MLKQCIFCGEGRDLYEAFTVERADQRGKRVLKKGEGGRKKGRFGFILL